VTDDARDRDTVGDDRAPLPPQRNTAEPCVDTDERCLLARVLSSEVSMTQSSRERRWTFPAGR
jgi:hypothetical protein